MAKVVVEIDTDTKVMSATVDGKEVENCREVNIMYDPDGDYFYLVLTTMEKQGDLIAMTYLRASGSEKALAARGLDHLTSDAKPSPYNGLDAISGSNAIAQRLSRERRKKNF